MTLYRNPREEAEMAEMELEETQENEVNEIMSQEPTSVEDATFKKRYGDLRAHADRQAREAKERIAALEARVEAAARGQIKPPKSKEEVSAWAKEYPEFAGILETIVSDRIAEGLRESNGKLANIELRQKELDAQEAFLALQKLHPDLDKLLAKDSKFRKWLATQTPKIKSKMDSFDVDEASLVINLYKSQKKSTNAQGANEVDDSIEAAKVVRGSTGTSELSDDFGDYLFSESQIERESRKNPRWFTNNEDKIMEALRKGKVYMDLSGGAR